MPVALPVASLSHTVATVAQSTHSRTQSHTVTAHTVATSIQSHFTSRTKTHKDTILVSHTQ
jgi:hypothetical protein